MVQRGLPADPGVRLNRQENLDAQPVDIPLYLLEYVGDGRPTRNPCSGIDLVDLLMVALQNLAIQGIEPSLITSAILSDREEAREDKPGRSRIEGILPQLISRPGVRWRIRWDIVVDPQGKAEHIR